MNALSNLRLLVAAACLCAGPAAQAEPDAEAAQALLRRNNCLKCHSIEKEKAGPAYRHVAQTWRGRADAEAKLVRHLTSGEVVTLADGHEESHKVIQTNPPNDRAQILNLVQWILSL